MIVFWIVLAIIALLALLILFGSASIRIVCKEKLRVVATVCGIRFTLISDKEKKKKPPKDFERCRDPEKALRKELKRQRKLAEKAERKRLKALKKAEKKKKKQQTEKTGRKAPTPNLKENLEMILALLKKLYSLTAGKLHIRVRKMQIEVGSGDAASTAILYGVILQSASYVLNFIETSFNHIEREDGDMSITPNYTLGHCSADIDIACSIKLRRGIALAVGMLLSYNEEKTIARKKATLRQKKKLLESRSIAVKK